MSDRERIEGVVNVVVGRPLAWVVHGCVVGICYTIASAIWCGRWIKQRWIRLRATV